MYTLQRHYFSLLKWYRSLERGKCQSYSCLVVHATVKVFNAYLWYLDSGCSQHMTGDKTLFTHLKEMKDDFVMFGDGSHSQVLVKGSIEIPGFPILKEVLYIDGLKANLLSIISQIVWRQLSCLLFHEEVSSIQWRRNASYVWLKNCRHLLWHCAKLKAVM